MLTLPTPDAIALQHSQRLLQKIIEAIEEKGPLTFAQYMKMALYEPGLGYYSAGAYKFGEQGDFVTAPEISPLFSRCVARQCLQVLRDLPNSVILEFGAGSGKMALDILNELEKQNALPVRYYILEVSADLKSRQQQLFAENAPHFLERIEWINTWPEQPLSGVIVANEVLDAMPVHKFKRHENNWHEYYINTQFDKLIWELKSLSSKELEQAILQLELNASEGYESEINLMLPAWIKEISQCLTQGMVLLIDYGFPRHEFYHPDRSEGTLMCHYRHRAHADPLFLPGLQDITAHVDFTAVAWAADAAGLNVAGFTHQAAFLINCGLAEIAQADNEWEQIKKNQQIKTLTLPSEMGELFKACALTKCYDASLLGFQTMNQLERL